MYLTVVITCGVSLFNGRNNIFSNSRQGIPKFPVSLQEKNLGKDTRQKIDQWLHDVKPFFDEMKDKQSQISAEYSTVYQLKKQRKLVERPLIILFFTNTAGGYAAEKILKEVLEEHFNAIVNVFFVDINVDHPQTLNRDVGDYMQKLAESLETGEPTTTCFAPIGGYKVMTSFGYIVGSFLGYPTAYLHEDNQIFHQIPPVPIQMDLDLIQQYSTLLRKCQADYIDFESLTYQEQNFVRKFHSLFTLEEGMVCLNPFGCFMLERTKYSYLLQTKYFVSKQVQNIIEKSKHQSLFITQQMRELVKKLKTGEGRLSELQHEMEFKGINQQSTKFHLYKGASNGQTAFRLAYKYDESNDILYANYLWLDHDRYEREAAQGKGLYEEVSSFTDMTEEAIQLKG